MNPARKSLAIRGKRLGPSDGQARHLLRAWCRDNRGLAAIEFAFVAGFLCVAVLNVADVSVFLFDRIMVNNAAQMGVQAAWATCDLNHLPASTKCPSMNSAVTSAVQSTQLGTHITLQSGSPS